jgi:hypothetical protein
VQVPAQALLVLRAGSDQILAVVEQELQLQGLFVEVGGGKGLGSLTQGCAGDGQSVDRIGLAAGALAPATLAHQLRRHPDDALAAGHQETLEGARDVAAVLERPDPLLVEVPAPGEQLAKAGPSR